MRNKKGFTLIELLAVVLIIGILLLIAVPGVTKFLSKGTTEYYKSMENNIIIAGREYLNDYRSLLPKKIGNVTVIELNELVSNNYIDEVVDDNDNTCEARMTVKKVNKKDYEYYTCLICDGYQTEGENCSYTEEDNVTPETKNYSINVKNSGFFKVNQGDDFTVPTAEAYYLGQLVDGNVVGNPKIIDTNKLGKTTVTYSYQGAKNSITVEVVDSVKPSIPQVILRYDNANGKNYGGNWYNGNIYVEFKSTDYSKNNIVGSGIAYYEVSKDKNNWEKLSGNNKIITESGDITYYVRAIDIYGNASDENTYNVKIDKIQFECKILVNGTKGKNDWYTSNVKLFVQPNKELLSGVKLTSLSQDSITTNTTGQKVTASITSGSGITVACDLNVKIDKKMPETPALSANDGIESGSWHNVNTTLTASGSSSTSGIVYYIDTKSDPTTAKNSETISINSTSTSGITYYAKACNGAGTCSGISNYVLKLDKVVPPTPSLAVSDSIQSNEWHKAEFTVTSSGGNNISGNTYHYGTSVAANSTNSNKAPFSDNTTASTYYFKICSGAGLCSETPASYVVKLDKSVPTVTAKNASNYITTTTGASITSYFNITNVISGNTTVCKVGSTTVTNTNNLSLGTNTVTCTSTSGSGLSSSASTVFKHQYVATATCASGYTLSGSTCSRQVFSHYSCPNGGTLSGSKCNTSSTYTGTPTCASGYTLSGSQCSRQVFSHYSCPNGGSLSGSTCYTSSSYTASYACNGGRTLSGSNCVYSYTNNSSKCGCKTTGCTSWKTGSAFDSPNDQKDARCSLECSGKSSCSCNCTHNGSHFTCKATWCTATGCTKGNDCTLTENEYRYSTCPNGGSLSGTTCTISGSYNATANNKTETVNATYTCPNGGSLSGTTCTISGQYNATANNKTETIGATYVCPSGGSLSGTTCSF